MFKLIESETVQATKAEAEAHRDMKRAPVERPIDDRRLDYLRNKVAEGLFINCLWVVARHNGVDYRMNGQHSATVLAECNGKFPEVHVHRDVYECSESHDFVMLFRQFDDRRSSRSTTDVCGAYLGDIPSLAGVQSAAAKGMVSGIAWFVKNVGKDPVKGGRPVQKGDDAFEILYDETKQPFIVWASQHWNPKCRELKKSPVIAAMFGTFRKDESDADRFWNEVAKQSNPDEASPSMRLSMELVRPFEDRTVKITAREVYAKCIKAWNAYRRGVSVRDLRVDLKKDLPEIE